MCFHAQIWVIAFVHIGQFIQDTNFVLLLELKQPAFSLPQGRTWRKKARPAALRLSNDSLAGAILSGEAPDTPLDVMTFLSFC